MERRDQSDGTHTEPTDGYQPPVVEDLDTSHGPLVTPAGSGNIAPTGGGNKAAPREV